MATTAGPTGGPGGASQPRPPTNQQQPQQHPTPRSTPGQRFDQPGPIPARGPSRLGDYRIVKTLGEGSFGKVRLAEHQKTKQLVALKFIDRAKLSRDTNDRVEREIQYLKLLRHPHIIKLHDVIQTSAHIIMVIEYAGNELFDYIVKHGKLSEKEGRRFFQQIMSAVDYTHRHKIVHRDLKPENLLLDADLNVKIADFGLSNLLEDGKFLKTSCGSPNYAAPEVIAGRVYAGPEVDIWSCGVILYVLLCGRLPFDDESIPKLFEKIRDGIYSMPSHLSEGARRLIAKMLVTNSEERATIPQIFEDPWFKVDLPDYLNPAGGAPLTPAKSPKDPQSHLNETIVAKVAESLGYTPEDVIGFLSEPRDNSAKKAYYLIAETEAIHQSTEKAQQKGITKNDSYLSASPPPWNHSDLQHRLTQTRVHPMSRFGTLQMTSTSPAPQSSTPDSSSVEPGVDDENNHGKANKRSKISLLTSSYPLVHARMYSRSTDQGADASRSVRGINLEHLPREMRVVTPVIKRKPQRYHFGIRSRGQGALEVMQEIYKSLERMGAEWIEKQPNPDSEDKTIPLDPFTIKCRWRKQYPRKSLHQKGKLDGEDDMYVYMEIQLYQQPEPRDYLVDFKWVGYELIGVEKKNPVVKLEGGVEGEGPPAEDTVHSCFPFLDLASTLINALARGGD